MVKPIYIILISSILLGAVGATILILYNKNSSKASIGSGSDLTLTDQITQFNKIYKPETKNCERFDPDCYLDQYTKLFQNDQMRSDNNQPIRTNPIQLSIMGNTPEETVSLNNGLPDKQNNSSLSTDDINNLFDFQPQDDVTYSYVDTIVDPSSTFTNSVDNNNSNITDSNTQYNLYNIPDESNIEIVTARDIYNNTYDPSIVDDGFYHKDQIYNIIDSYDLITNKIVKSINDDKNISPINTDGIVYYPLDEARNTENLMNIAKEGLYNSQNISGLYMDNSVLADSEFTV